MPSGGRPRQLTPAAVLVGLLVALDAGRPAHLVAGWEALCDLDVADQIRLEVAASDDGVLSLVTYRQFQDTYQAMTRAIDPSPVPSFKGVAEGDRAAHLEKARAAVDVEATGARLSSVLDALCEASVPETYKAASTSLAIDWTDYATWSRPRAKDDPQPAADPDASWGHAKGNAPGEREHLFFGYYAQAAPMVADEGGPTVAELARRAAFAAPSVDPAKEMAKMMCRGYNDGIAPGDLLSDCGYSNRDPDTFARPLRRAGARLVMDLHPNDRGPKGTCKGAVICNGNLYCPTTPRALLELGPLPRGASAEDSAAQDARCAELARYKLGRISSDDEDGAHRVMCPAAMGKLRCPLRPASTALDHSHPEVLSPPEHPPACCSQKTITVEEAVLAKTAQKHDYPSRAHRLSYNRRTGAERPFAWLKDPATTGMVRGWCWLFGRTKNALMFTLALVVRNVRLVESSGRRRADEARRAAMGLSPRRRRRRRRRPDHEPARGEPPPAEHPRAPG